MAPTTPGTESTWSRTWRHPVNSFWPAFMRMPWAFWPRMRAFRSPSKPFITESTTVSAQTPMATPPMEMSVISSVSAMRRGPSSRPRRSARRSRASATSERTRRKSRPGRIPVTTSAKSASRVRRVSLRWLLAT